MKISSSTILVVSLRKIGLLAALICTAMLTACTTVAPGYQATVDNVKALQKVPGNGAADVGKFTVADESLNRLTIRASVYKSPSNGSFAEYIKEALRSELGSAGKLGSRTNAVISGQLLKNSIDGSYGVGTANVSVRFTVTHGTTISYEKIISGETKWDSPFIGAIAIPEAQRNHTEAVKQLLAKLFSDPDFQKSIQ